MYSILIKPVKSIWQQNSTFLIFILLIFASKSALGDWNTVPSASMKPNIIEGDRIFVNKLAYDLHIPFTQISIARFDNPKRNDIIIFESKVADKRLVKRVVGLPGDQVSLENNRLMINGESAIYSSPSTIDNSEKLILTDKTRYIDLNEAISGKTHSIRLLENVGGVPSTFNTISVPKDHYLVMGDNRNISADSRIIGFVPRKEIIGNTTTVVMSLNYDNYFFPRSSRWLKEI